jgi:hypothetical protein
MRLGRMAGRNGLELLLLLRGILLPRLLHDERPAGSSVRRDFMRDSALATRSGCSAARSFVSARSVAEVVEFDGLGGAVADGFPVAKADGLKRCSFMEFPVKGFALGGGAAFEQLDDGVAVVRGFEFDSGELGGGG